ncbi:MAG: hypothetical protein ACREAB_03905 [Blastocatellia bacterium]
MAATVETIPARRVSNTIADLALLILITALALAVHGFHYGIEDEAIYLPAIKKYLDPQLYPLDSVFFLSQTNLTIFPVLVAFLAQVTSLPLAWIVFITHLLSLFLVLTACWRLSRQCFADTKAQWAAVVRVSAVMTLPVAGTALYVIDQHLHPRSLATAAILWSLSELLERCYYKAGLGLLIALLIHPMMGAFGVVFGVFLLWRSGKQLLVFCLVPLLLAPLPFALEAPSGAWGEAVSGCPYYYLLRWEWYEWVGIFAPLALLGWFGYPGQRDGLKVLQRISWRLVAFGLFFFILAVVLTIPSRFERAVSFQPMRFLHLVYLLLFMLAGGLIGKRILRDRPMRWLILFAPLCVLMFLVQRQMFSASPHIELPGITRNNRWLEAFEWIRQNTPRDAMFALDPYYLESHGLDHHGFRGLAERGMLADRGKDRTVTTLAPAIAETWLEQVNARDGWRDFRSEDWRRLKKGFDVTWVVIENRGALNPPAGLACPYHNEAVSVCKID